MAAKPILNLAAWLEALERALGGGDVDAAADLFAPDGFWRDFAAFTWNLQTLEGQGAIRAMLHERLARTTPSAWTPASPQADEAQEGFITFETALGRGEGYVRLRDGRCWSLLTTLRELKGHEERRGVRRPLGDEASPAVGVEVEPYVLIVGGGQGGLSLAARLKQLDVPTLVVDRYARPGDQWRSRYKSLSLHDPVWYDHLPYMPFPDTWPVFTPKDQIADWLEAYARFMKLNIWGSTDCVGADYDEAAGHWRVRLRRDGADIELKPTHLVLATGNSGRPNRPRFPGAESFAGVQRHSSEHPGGEGLAGQRVVVIGANNSAHDICADLVEHGVDVTMVQRSSTHVIRSRSLIEALAPLYSEEAVAAGLDVEKADLMVASVPLRILADVQRPAVAAMAEREADFYARLEAAGFMLDFGEDGSGMALKYLRRASGYYVDVGASEMIASGAIKLRSRVGVDHIEQDGVVLSDGSKLEADMIIYATGFGSMDQFAADLISPEVAEKVGKVWGYGSGTTNDPGPWEGELRNMWKPTAQEGLWFHGGNLQQARFYSRFLALQLKARQLGLAAAPYRG